MSKYTFRDYRRFRVWFIALALSFFFTAPLLILTGFPCHSSRRVIASMMAELDELKNAMHLNSAHQTSLSQSGSHDVSAGSQNPIPKPITSRKRPPIVADDSLNQSDEETFVNDATTSSRADWSGVNTYHRFCKKIIDYPLPAPALPCQRNSAMMCVNGKMKGKIPFFALGGQDYYLFTSHFKNLKRQGIYIDVGAQHPTIASSTYFLDACLRWKGVCIEPNSETYQDLYRQRSCDLVPTCVSAQSNRHVMFLSKGTVGGIDGDTRNLELLSNNGVTKTKLTCTSLTAIMRRGNIKFLDYLTVSVDGNELGVLKGIDFKRRTINVISVSTTPSSLPEIENFLQSENYVRHIPKTNTHFPSSPQLDREAIFAHKDVVWGYPI